MTKSRSTCGPCGKCRTCPRTNYNNKSEFQLQNVKVTDISGKISVSSTPTRSTRLKAKLKLGK